MSMLPPPNPGQRPVPAAPPTAPAAPSAPPAPDEPTIVRVPRSRPAVLDGASTGAARPTLADRTVGQSPATGTWSATTSAANVSATGSARSTRSAAGASQPGSADTARIARPRILIGAGIAAVVIALVGWRVINSDETPTGAEISAQTALSTPADTGLGAADTVLASVVPTAAPSVPATVAPTIPATVAPTTAPTTPATIASPPPVSIAIPAGSVVASDPAGWTMAVDPAWSDTSTNGVRTFFIQPAATAGDNVNVTIETLPPGVGIDAYVEAALSTIAGAAPDFVLAGQRRDSAVDGVQIELVAWSATLPGLPKLAFLQAITVTPTTAYIATFTSPPETMPNIAPFVEPYLLTVRGT